MAKVTHGSVQAAAPALSVSMLMHPEDTASAVVSGELDLTTAPTLTELAVCALQQGARHVLLDLTGVTFCDARGLAAFVCIANQADAAGGGLTLTGVPPRVTRMLQTTGLARRFPDTDTASADQPAGTDTPAVPGVETGTAVSAEQVA